MRGNGAIRYGTQHSISHNKQHVTQPRAGTDTSTNAQRALLWGLIACLWITPASGVGAPTRSFVENHPVFTVLGVGGAMALVGIFGAYRLRRGPLQRLNRYLNSLPVPMEPIRRSVAQCVGQWIDGLVGLILNKLVPGTSVITTNTSFIFAPLYTHFLETTLSPTGSAGLAIREVPAELKPIQEALTQALDNPRVPRTEGFLNKLFGTHQVSVLSAEQENTLEKLRNSMGKDILPDELINAWKAGETAEFAYIGLAGSGKTYSVIELGKLLNRTVVVIDARLFKDWPISGVDTVTQIWEQLITERLQDGSLQKDDFVFLDATDHMTGRDAAQSKDNSKQHDIDLANNKLLLAFQNILYAHGLNFAWAANIVEESIPNEIRRNIETHNGHLAIARLKSDKAARIQVCWNKVHDLTISTKPEDADMAQKLQAESAQRIIGQVIEKIGTDTECCPSAQIAALCERVLGTLLAHEQITDQDIENELAKQTLRTYRETLSTTLEKMLEHCQQSEKTARDIETRAKIRHQIEQLEGDIEKIRERINDKQALLKQKNLLDVQEVLSIMGTYTHEMELLNKKLQKAEKARLEAQVHVSQIALLKNQLNEQWKKIPQAKEDLEKLTETQKLETCLLEARINQCAYDFTEQESLVKKYAGRVTRISEKTKRLETWQKKYSI